MRSATLLFVRGCVFVTFAVLSAICFSVQAFAGPLLHPPLKAFAAEPPANGQSESSGKSPVTDTWVATVKHMGVTPPLSTIKNPYVSKGLHEAEPVRTPPQPPFVPNPNFVDPVLQTFSPSTLTLNLGANYDGVGNGFTGPNGTYSDDSIPPDTDVAAGTTQIISLDNSAFAIFSKSTGAVLGGPYDTNTLWSALGTSNDCYVNDDGDGIVKFDQLAQRWLITQFQVTTTPFHQCMAISQTADATGSWTVFEFVANPPHGYFGDYPKLSVWPNVYSMTFDFFNTAGTAYEAGGICGINRAALLAGSASATIVCASLSSSDYALLPVDLDGATYPPVANTNALYLEQNSSSSPSTTLYMYSAAYNFTAGTVTVGSKQTITVGSYTWGCGTSSTYCIVQPTYTGAVGSTVQNGTFLANEKLDSLEEHLMYRAAYRNFGSYESITLSHTAKGSGTSQAAERWYEIRSPFGTPSVYQQSTWSPDSSLHRWMGSIAQDHNGDIALGYSGSDSAVFPSVYTTGRLSTDPVSTMESEIQLYAGSAQQVALQGFGSSGPVTGERWGDYTAMMIDPDDCTFWYTGEYIKQTGSFNWNTRIFSFSFPSCSSPASITLPVYNSAGGSALTSGTQTFYWTPGSGSPTGYSLSVGSTQGGSDYCGGAQSYGSGVYTGTLSCLPTNGSNYWVRLTSSAGTDAGYQDYQYTAPVVGSYALSASPGAVSVTEGASAQTSTITDTASGGFVGEVNLTASGVPSGVTVTFGTNPTQSTSVASFSASNSATPGTYSITITGTSGTAAQQTTTVSVTVVSGQQSQTINFTTNAPASAAYSSSFGVAAAATSGLTVSFTAAGNCSVVDHGNGTATYTMTSGTGSCSVIANQAGNSSYSAAPQVTQSVGATLAANTVTLSNVPVSAEYGSTFTISASGLGTGAITYTSDGLVCTNSGASYTVISATGSCTVSASQAADSNYASASNTAYVTADPAQTSVGVQSSGSPSVYGASVTFTATITTDTSSVKGRSTRKGNVKSQVLSGTVSWSGNTGCTSSQVTGNPPQTVTCTTSSLGVGSDTVTASYAADPNHTAASGNTSQTVNQTTSAISVTSVSPAAEDYGADNTVTITAQLTWTGGGVAPTASDVTIGGSGFSGSFGTTACGAASGDTITCTNTYTPTTNDVAGTYTFTAAFSGDTNYRASSSSQSNNFTINDASATVTVLSSANPSAYGEPITFTANIVGENNAVKGRTTRRNGVKSNAVTGSVTWSSFTGCGTTAVTTNPDGSGTATCVTSSLRVGTTDHVKATYSGDANHNSAVGEYNNEVVNQASSTLSVTSVSPSSEDYGSAAAVTITAQLSWTGTGAAPTGAVTIGGTGSAGTYSSTTCGAASGNTITCSATYTPNNDAPGSYTENASYAGDSNYTASSSSQSGNFTINQATTTTAVTSNVNPSTYGSPVTFTATIAAENNFVKGRNSRKGRVKSNDVTGTVSWSSNTGCSTSTVTWSAVNLNATATCTTSTLDVGSDTVTGTYSGDSNHQSSNGQVSQQVNGGVATAISVSNVSPSSEDYAADSPVTITAVLSWTGNAAAPTAADVSIGGNGNGTYGATSCGAPSGDTMTCSASYTPNNADVAGSYTETATFSGDNHYSASSSSQTNNFTINAATSSVSVSSSSNSNTSTYGQSVTFTATVTGENGDVKGRAGRNGKVKSNDVTGTVNWSANTGCSSSTVSGYPGVATCTTSALNAGSDTVTASYSGDANHGGSNGSVIQTVNQASQTITFRTNAPASAVYNSQFTVAATASSGLAVTFTSSGGCSNNSATYTMTSGTTSCLVTAQQAGNSNYSAATPVNQSVTATLASQTITATPPAEALDKDSFTVAASGGASGNPLAFASSGDCSNSGATYTMGTKAGTCTGTITQAANSDYAAATYTWNTTVITKLVAPAVTFTGAPSTAVGGSSFTVTATYPNTQGVPAEVPTIAASGSCTAGSVTGSGTTYQSTITMTKGSETCTLTAKWAKNFYYAAATETQKTTAERTAPTVSFTGAPSTAVDGAQFTVTATSNEGGAYAVVPTITASGGACSAGAVSGSGGTYQATITMTKSKGTCTMTAKWAASIEYETETLKQTTTAP